MIRAILVDDEKLALQLMEKKLNDLGSVEIIKTFSSAESVIKELKFLDFQVAFLDIEMTGISGLDLAEMIQECNNSVHIVFVTAYRDYAIQAFELNSIDYLLKPVLTNRLEKTITRIQDEITKNSNYKNPLKQKPTSLNIYCLNEFIVYNDTEPVKWKTAKVKELFAFFITHLNTYTNRDTIINALWPDQDYKKSKIQLHTCISHLRKTLESLGYKQALTFSNQSYSLQLDYFFCDVIELEKIMSYKIISNENITSIEKAISMYTGDYMEINAYQWSYTKSQYLRQKLLHTLQDLVNFYSIHKNFVKKSENLQLLFKLNPYSESILRQLMTHYSEVGNRGDAIKSYLEFEHILHEDLDIQPEQATIELYHSICDS